MSDEETFVFLVPEVEAAAVATKEKDVALKSLGVLRRTASVPITRRQLEEFWKEKVVGLTEALAEAQAEKATKGFHVDEISFSLGVSATGGVSFVAQGSVEASMSITLRRA